MIPSARPSSVSTSSCTPAAVVTASKPAFVKAACRPSRTGASCVVVRIAANHRAWKWFGPVSLVPNWQDLKDMIAMFRWFFGKAPRPVFDRWTYWEKFDYWAVFWGMAIIGGSGLILWFPAQFAAFLPGWVFNVATVVHGEEALLAVGFIFTIHFFNGHIRPEKFPMDLVIFTGRIPEHELKDERPGEYRRLVSDGRLESVETTPPTPWTEAFGYLMRWRSIKAFEDRGDPERAIELADHLLHHEAGRPGRAR